MFTIMIRGAGNAGDVQWQLGQPTTEIEETLRRESEKLVF